jgi:hypothetical protein
MCDGSHGIENEKFFPLFLPCPTTDTRVPEEEARNLVLAAEKQGS